LLIVSDIKVADRQSDMSTDNKGRLKLAAARAKKVSNAHHIKINRKCTNKIKEEQEAKLSLGQ